MTSDTKYPTTPDGRYFIVRETLWRCTNPSIPEEQRKNLVKDLMNARRMIKSTKDDPEELKKVRQSIQRTKEDLGERGKPWWDDDSPDYNRHKVKNTPYADWYAGLEEQSID